MSPRLRRQCAEVSHHRRIQPGTVAVLVTVHRFWCEGMAELNQAAGIGSGFPALDGFEGPLFHRLATFWEHTRERLATQIEDGNELVVPANPATGNLFVHNLS